MFIELVIILSIVTATTARITCSIAIANSSTATIMNEQAESASPSPP